MLRFLLTIFIWITFVGGVGVYMHLRDSGQASPALAEAAPEAARAVYDIELTPTFSAQADPFALRTTDDDTPAITVTLNGASIGAIPSDISPGQPWLRRAVPGVVQGANEIYVQTAPPVSAGGTRHAVRVRILRNGQPTAETTFWNDGGASVSGTLRFTAASDGDHS